MGSLPVPAFPSKHCLDESSHIDEATLSALFKSQQSHLNFFFDHIDHSQTLAFTCALLNAAGIVFFTDVEKSGFVAHKISQTLVSLASGCFPR